MNVQYIRSDFTSERYRVLANRKGVADIIVNPYTVRTHRTNDSEQIIRINVLMVLNSHTNSILAQFGRYFLQHIDAIINMFEPRPS